MKSIFLENEANKSEQHCAFISSIGIKQVFRGPGIGALLINKAVRSGAGTGNATNSS